MGERISKIRADHPADTLTGDEIVVLNQAGQTRAATVSQFAALLGGLTITPHVDSYEFTAGDANSGHANPAGNGNNSYFIPGHSTIDYPVGTFFTVFNRDNPGTVTITVEEDTLIGAADASTGTVVTINARGMATVCKTADNEWTVVGSNISAVG